MLPACASPRRPAAFLMMTAAVALMAAQPGLAQDVAQTQQIQQQPAPSIPTEAPGQPLPAPAAEDQAEPALPGAEAAAPVTTPDTTSGAVSTPLSTAAEGATAGTEAAEPVAGAQAAAVPGAAPESSLPHDLSPWGMFMAADIVVKAVMLLLAAASLATWTVLLFKLCEMALARARLKRAGRVLGASSDLEGAAHGLAGLRDPGSWLVRAALEELNLSRPAVALAGPSGVKERVHSIVERTVAQAGRRLQRGTGLLATIGSIAPFVGLFGTVWGIMNSFIGISESQTTNLAIVAPGIAEALLATAIGLVAAIPAVVIYNHFARAITGYRQALGDVGAAVERLLSRDLDFDHAQPARGSRLSAVEG